MKILFNLLMIFTICAMSLCSSTAQQPANKNRTYPKTAQLKFNAIHELKASAPKSGEFNTSGYVVKIYRCPPCPPNADCKPCMRDNIVISEDNQPRETYNNLTNKDLIIFADNVEQFELGKKYSFSVKIGNESSTSEPINDIEMAGYE